MKCPKCGGDLQYVEIGTYKLILDIKDGKAIWTKEDWMGAKVIEIDVKKVECTKCDYEQEGVRLGDGNKITL